MTSFTQDAKNIELSRRKNSSPTLIYNRRSLYCLQREKSIYINILRHYLYSISTTKEQTNYRKMREKIKIHEKTTTEITYKEKISLKRETELEN